MQSDQRQRIISILDITLAGDMLSQEDYLAAVAALDGSVALARQVKVLGAANRDLRDISAALSTIRSKQAIISADLDALASGKEPPG